MKTSFMIRNLDSYGRLTLPKEIRSKLKLNTSDEVRIYLDGERLIIEKGESVLTDLFDNMVVSEPLYEYHGKKIARSSIVELASIAGLISD